MTGTGDDGTPEVGTAAPDGTASGEPLVARSPAFRLDLVELVAPDGHAVGVAGKVAAHVAPGRLHRAISVFVLDPSGRLVLQRRAAGKYHSEGLWSNTCCGHPAPGEPPNVAASRRLDAELGLRVPPERLTFVGVVEYDVRDEPSGLVEREYNHLFVGRTAERPRPDPEEVAEVRLAALEELTDGDEPPGFTPWFGIVLRAALPGLLAELASDPAADGPPPA